MKHLAARGCSSDVIQAPWCLGCLSDPHRSVSRCFKYCTGRSSSTGCHSFTFFPASMFTYPTTTFPLYQTAWFFLPLLVSSRGNIWVFVLQSSEYFIIKIQTLLLGKQHQIHVHTKSHNSSMLAFRPLRCSLQYLRVHAPQSQDTELETAPCNNNCHVWVVRRTNRIKHPSRLLREFHHIMAYHSRPFICHNKVSLLQLMQ